MQSKYVRDELHIQAENIHKYELYVPYCVKSADTATKGNHGMIGNIPGQSCLHMIVRNMKEVQATRAQWCRLVSGATPSILPAVMTMANTDETT